MHFAAIRAGHGGSANCLLPCPEADLPEATFRDGLLRFAADLRIPTGATLTVVLSGGAWWEVAEDGSVQPASG